MEASTPNGAHGGLFSFISRRIGRHLAVILGSFLTAMIATGVRGDWLLFYVHVKKLWLGDGALSSPSDKEYDVDDDNETTSSVIVDLEEYHMQDVGFYLLGSIIGAFAIFYGVGGWLKWHYYYRLRERATDWKCQPDRFLTPEDDKLEFWLGSFNMAIGSLLAGLLVTYIMNGGETALYYRVTDYGAIYFLLSIPLTHLYNEASMYYTHRSLHHPFFYQRFHKLHHRFKAPTPWSGAAMHPVEFLVFQFFLVIPIFLVPLHAGVFLLWLVYSIYHGIVSHSGIDLHSNLPWQPSVMFHDDHHKFFHCNFGVNTMLFDRFHGTLRRADRFYSEKTFGGKGAPWQDSSKDS